MAASAVGPTDVWAVGYSGSDSLALHWDGTAWTAVPLPYFSGTWLRGVAAVAANDVWAVGDDGGSMGGGMMLIFLWDGTAWTRVATPGSLIGQLHGITAISATDIWVVGWRAPNTILTPLALHWDGTSWSEVPTPDPQPGLIGLFAVDASSSTAVWAVGEVATPRFSLIIMHWDGTVWSVEPSPVTLPGTTNYLFAVAAVAPDDAWAVGGVTTSTGASNIIHWDGTEWRPVPAPGVGNLYPAIAAVAADDIWAVSGWSETVAAHYSNLCITPSPSPTASSSPTATSTPTAGSPVPTATPTPLTGRPDAHVEVSLRQDPDGAVPPGGLVTFTISLQNAGPAEADGSSVRLPLDPNLEVLDFHSSDSRFYVDYLGEDAVAVRFHDLGVGRGGTAQIIARVRPTAALGVTITSRAEAAWHDTRRRTRHSNSVILVVGPAQDLEQHGLVRVLTVEPEDAVAAGTPLTLHGDFFAEEEPVSIWLNGPGDGVQSVTERARSEQTGTVIIQLPTNDLAPGSYTLVAHGWESGVEGVGAFTVR
jgi:hypothetical protein